MTEEMQKLTSEKAVPKDIVGIPEDDYYVVIEKHAGQVLGFVMTLVLTQMEMQAFPAADAASAIRFRTLRQAESYCGMPDDKLMKANRIEFIPFHVTKDLKGKTHMLQIFQPVKKPVPGAVQCTGKSVLKTELPE